jgi:hypothetical protein
MSAASPIRPAGSSPAYVDANRPVGGTVEGIVEAFHGRSRSTPKSQIG